jgi:uncharacterized protein YaaR (DUF327 family)
MFTETEIFLILLILCSIIVNVVLYFMWNIATKKFSELQKQYIDYLTKCSNDLKEKESILKAYDTSLHNNKILCEAVKELLKPDADTVKVSRKLGEIKCLK